MKYAGLIKNDVVNGYDVCVSYWCQGCRFRCPGCHNPETWDFDGGADIEEDDLIDKIIESISQNDIQRNLSILGGEPLCPENMRFTARLISAAIEVYPTIKIFIWTGYEFEYLWQVVKDNEYIDYILAHVDVMVDGKFDLQSRDITLPFRGSKNQRVIDVPKTLANKNIVLYCK